MHSGLLLKLPFYGAGTYRSYDITPDGRRFLAVDANVLVSDDVGHRPRINVVLHWFEELKQLAPAGR